MEERITPNANILENLFNLYNMQLFDFSLETPTFIINNSKTIIGNFRYEYIGQNDNSIVIEISGRYRYTMYQLLSILIHEMLHYYLSAVYHLNTANHDKIFMDMADKLNESNDFHITPTIDLTDYERIKTKSSMNKLCDWLFDYSKKTLPTIQKLLATLHLLIKVINNEKKENELFMTDNRQRNNGKREEEK